MKLFNRLSRRSKLAIATVLTLCAIAIPAVVVAGPAPDRPTKVYTDGVAGFSYPTFNSFTNVPNIGDERNFFNGLYPGSKAYTDPMPQVKDGDTLTLEVYVHNDADPSLGDKGTAQNTNVRVSLPTGIATKQEATAYISSSNANPKVVSDTLDFGAANGGNFQLAYVPGSAHVQGNYINSAVSDSIVTTGAPIGTDKLDGNLKGCFQQMVVVTFQVKVKMPNYSLNKQVRMKGQGASAWTKSVTAKGGDTVQWLMTFNDTGKTDLNQVDVVDQVPAGLTVVPGTVRLFNGNYPNGYTYPNSAIQSNGRQVNVNIGNYGPGILAYVEFDTTVNKLASTVCSDQTIMNKAYATPQGFGAIWDTASVTVKGNTCKPTPPPTPSYACSLLTVTPGANRTVTISDFKTTQNNATFKDAVITWGDSSTALTTNNVIGQTHQYAADGTYTINATAHFTVNGKEVSATSDTCSKTVSFTTPGTPTTPSTPGQPTQLVNTGAGSTIGLFASAMVVGMVAYRLILGRRLSREG